MLAAVLDSIYDETMEIRGDVIAVGPGGEVIRQVLIHG